MKKVLSSLVLLSTIGASLSAAAMTSQFCDLGQWCDLQRPSDKVLMQIPFEGKNDLMCTLVVDGKFDPQGIVGASFKSGKNFDPEVGGICAAYQGSSSACRFITNLKEPFGYIEIRRQTGDRSNNPAHVMCDETGNNNRKK